MSNMRELKFRIYSFVSKYFIYFDVYEGVVKGNHCGLYEIYWDRCYKLKTIKPNWFFVPTFEGPAADYNIMKVVGNIFENKQLLN